MRNGYCTIMWNGRDCEAKEMNHHQQKTEDWSSSKEGDVVYMVGLERSPLLQAPSRKTND